MKRIFLIIIAVLTYSLIFPQDTTNDTLFKKPDLLPLLIDQELYPEMPTKLNISAFDFDLKEEAELDTGFNHLTIKPELYLDLPKITHPRFNSGVNFYLNATRWSAPVLGDITIFSPTLNYNVTEDLSFYGGLSFAQYHNLSYIQNIVAPGHPAKSNITTDLFVGGSYRLWDRLIFHANYQRSLYNQLPSNLMMFAPGQNVLSTGVAVDVWNGLGVMVEHVWEFDNHGRMRKGFRYSPYIDGRKLMKFFGAE